MSRKVKNHCKSLLKTLWITIMVMTVWQKADADDHGQSAQIKKSVIAGSWYSNDRLELKNQLNMFLENAQRVKVSGKIFALVVPHAGYAYSGKTAAYGYKQVISQGFNTVVILGPSHREYLSGGNIYPGDGFETPLGVAQIDKELAHHLTRKSKNLIFSQTGHQMEHSIEIQVPFIQQVLPRAKIVPIAIGKANWSICSEIGLALASAIGEKNVLLIASTDLYHGSSYSDCNRIDAETRNMIQVFNPQALCEGWLQEKAQACGGAAVVIAQVAAKSLGANKCDIIYHTNSADVTGQKNSDWIVGYTAAIIYKEANTMADEKVGTEVGLNKADQKTLMRIARETIERVVSGKKPAKYDITSNILKEKRGAFVTIKRGDELRGCIGYIFAYKPLFETIIEMAEAAALRDPRFMPVRPEELPQLSIEISVLTPIREIKNIDEIQVGTHGIIIEKQDYSGLLLPQVATEYGWDRETFLAHTCLKAGLPRTAWKDKDTKIKIFSAQVFGEDE